MTSKTLLSFFLIVGMLFSCQYAMATKVYYSCFGTNVTLSVPGSGYTAYLWKPLQGGSNITTATLPVTAPALGSSDFDTLKFTVEVQSTSGGCYSDPDTHLVVFLKPLNVVLPADTSVCINAWVNILITPEVGTVNPSNLPTGISVHRVWAVTNGGSGNPGANDANYTATTFGTYSLTQSYSGLATNGGSALATCATKNDEIVINQAVVPNAPSVDFAETP